jgi:hypothetical protein
MLVKQKRKRLTHASRMRRRLSADKPISGFRELSGVPSRFGARKTVAAATIRGRGGVRRNAEADPRAAAAPSGKPIPFQTANAKIARNWYCSSRKQGHVPKDDHRRIAWQREARRRDPENRRGPRRRFFPGGAVRAAAG